MFIAMGVGMAIDRLPLYLERLFGRRRVLDAFRVAIAGIARVAQLRMGARRTRRGTTGA